MRCDIHCPPDGGSLGGAVAVAVLAAALAAVAGIVLAVAAAVEAVLPVVTVTILGMCAAGCEVVRRLYLYGRRMRPARVVVAPGPSLSAAPARRSLPQRVPLMLPAPNTIAGEVIASATAPRQRLRKG